MKTIKFRGISIADGTMKTGSLYIGNINGQPLYAILTDEDCVVDSQLDSDAAFVLSLDEFHPVRPETVGQFLMNDSKGNPVYEGDIVRQHYSVTEEGADGLPTTIEGFHVGTARLTCEGAQLSNLRHYDADGSLKEVQPHKSKRIQMRSRRCEVTGCIHYKGYEDTETQETTI